MQKQNENVSALFAKTNLRLEEPTISFWKMRLLFYQNNTEKHTDFTKSFNDSMKMFSINEGNSQQHQEKLLMIKLVSYDELFMRVRNTLNLCF